MEKLLRRPARGAGRWRTGGLWAEVRGQRSEVRGQILRRPMEGTIEVRGGRYAGTPVRRYAGPLVDGGRQTVWGGKERLTGRGHAWVTGGWGRFEGAGKFIRREDRFIK